MGEGDAEGLIFIQPGTPLIQLIFMYIFIDIFRKIN